MALLAAPALVLPPETAALDIDRQQLPGRSSCRCVCMTPHKTDDAPAATPPMGCIYRLWKSFHFEASEDDAKKTADGLVSSGMRNARYRTLSLDGGWWGGGKSGKVRRNSSGFLTVNDTKFPRAGREATASCSSSASTARPEASSLGSTRPQ